MKSLVTGGAGFIGSHVVEHLLEAGHEVVVVDNESSIDASTFHWNSRCVNYKKDITNQLEISEVFESHNFDYVFHLAALTRIVPAMNDPATTLRANYVGTLNILELSRQHNIRRVIFSSSSSIYGTQEIPYSETAIPSCLNPYALSKLQGESLCAHYSEVFGLDTVCLRYFNVFGERMPEQGQYAPVIAIFLRQLREGIKLTVVGDGLQRRDFIYVKDVALANVNVALRSSNFVGQFINVGSTKMVSVLDIAKIISSDYTYIPSRKGDSQNTQADITTISKEIDWAPTIGVLDWVKEMLSQ